MVSKQNYRLLHNALLQNITFDPVHLEPLYTFIKTDMDAGKYIKFLRIDNSTEPRAMFTFDDMLHMSLIMAEEEEDLPKSINSNMDPYRLETTYIMMGVILNECVNLETYINRYPEILRMTLSSRRPENERIPHELPVPFLINSLKRLEISSTVRWDEGVLARQVIWILVFCVHLRQAIFTILISATGDAPYLEEYSETFKNLSKVKDLAIRLNINHNKKDPRTFWGTRAEKKKVWKLGSRKTGCVAALLSVTSKLNSLELWTECEENSEGDTTQVFEDCLAGLSSSFETLKHLRIFGARINRDRSEETQFDYSQFKALKILTWDLWGIRSFTTKSGHQLPQTLEVLCTEYYDYDRKYTLAECLDEDARIAFLFTERSRLPPNLKTVAVPREMIRRSYMNTGEPEFKAKWKLHRKALEDQDDIKSGKVQLRLLKEKEIRK